MKIMKQRSYCEKLSFLEVIFIKAMLKNKFLRNTSQTAGDQ